MMVRTLNLPMETLKDFRKRLKKGGLIIDTPCQFWLYPITVFSKIYKAFTRNC